MTLRVMHDHQSLAKHAGHEEAANIETTLETERELLGPAGSPCFRSTRAMARPSGATWSSGRQDRSRRRRSAG
jgi:hypothetical protein